MFDNTKKWFNDNWKKLALSGAAGLGSFFVLKYGIPNLLDVTVVSVGGALAVAYLVYTKVSLAEVNKLVGQAQDVAKKL